MTEQQQQHSAENGLGLTPAEHAVVRQAGDLWGAICAAIPDGPTRDADLAELVIHVHAIQHAVMANAAARAHPDTYRLLGGSLRTRPLSPERTCLCGSGEVPGRGGCSECR